MHDMRMPQELSQSDLRLLKELCELSFKMARYRRIPTHLKMQGKHMLARARRRELHCIENSVRLPHRMPYYVWPASLLKGFEKKVSNS